MKVLFVSNDPEVFAEGSEVRARMRAYAAAIGELHVISAAPRHASRTQEGGLLLHPVHAWGLFRFWSLMCTTQKIIRTHGIEVVSAQDPFEHGLVAYRAIRGTNAALHLQVHTDFLSPYFARESLKNRIRVHSAGRLIPKARGIRVVSKRIRDSLVAKFGATLPSVSVIPISVPMVVGEAVPLPSRASTFTLITVSRLEREKRIEDILQALALLAGSYPMIGLMVVGAGRERVRLESLTRKLGLLDRVAFLGWRTDSSGLMRSAQAFIQASAYEGYGRTLLEAALAKVPIITTDVGIVGDVLHADQEALVAPVADPRALSVYIARLVEDPGLRATLTLHAESAAKTHGEGNVEVVMQITKDLMRARAS